MKRLVAISMVFMGLSLSGCFTITIPTRHACQVVDAHTLRLAGHVDAKMLKCAQDNLDENIDRIIVSSFGGNTKFGRKIGDLIARKPRTVIVRGECLSSCGNYFIPTAKALVIEPESFIGLHGGIDPMTIGRLAKKENKPYAEIAELYAEELEDENRFAQQYHVPHGWRIYRERDEPPLIASKGLKGQVRDNGTNRRTGLLLVEREMLESCLPHVKIIEEHIDETVIHTNSKKYAKRLKTLGTVGSGSLRCKLGDE